MNGTRFSVRAPSRIVPSCVSEPIGSPIPRRASSTPAMSVLVTAPSPTHRMPSFPSAGAIEVGLLAVMGSGMGGHRRTERTGKLPNRPKVGSRYRYERPIGGRRDVLYRDHERGSTDRRQLLNAVDRRHESAAQAGRGLHTTTLSARARRTELLGNPVPHVKQVAP